MYMKSNKKNNTKNNRKKQESYKHKRKAYTRHHKGNQSGGVDPDDVKNINCTGLNNSTNIQTIHPDYTKIFNETNANKRGKLKIYYDNEVNDKTKEKKISDYIERINLLITTIDNDSTLRTPTTNKENQEDVATNFYQILFDSRDETIELGKNMKAINMKYDCYYLLAHYILS